MTRKPGKPAPIALFLSRYIKKSLEGKKICSHIFLAITQAYFFFFETTFATTAILFDRKTFRYIRIKQEETHSKLKESAICSILACCYLQTL